MTKWDKDYIDLVKRIREFGYTEDNDRTGDGTWSVTGAMIEHDMALGFPLLTVKYVPWKLIFGETEFFLKGKHDKNWLKDHPFKIKIWNEWGDQEVVNAHIRAQEAFRFHASTNTDPDVIPSCFKMTDDEKKELQAKINQLGPVYGVQWRRFNHAYDPNNLDETKVTLKQKAMNFFLKLGGIEPVDQLQNLVDMLKSGKSSRRMYVTAINPSQEKNQALPPCHTYWQVIRRGNKLDLLFFMRSTDVFLGLPFNMASYALILSLLCNETGDTPGKVIYMGADVHLYQTHTEAIDILLTREGKDTYPTLKVDEGATVMNFDAYFPGTIVDKDICSAHVDGYEYEKSIKAKVSI